MGKYINSMPNGTPLPSKGKTAYLDLIPGSVALSSAPTKWQEGIVCIIDDGPFEAAGYAFDENELRVFARFDGRPRNWMIIPGAKELAK